MNFHGLFPKPRQKSQALVEFALVLPILLLVVYGTLEVGRLIFTYSTVITAARQAVRYGSANGLISGEPQYKNCAGIIDAAKNVDFLGVIDPANIQISYAPLSGDDPAFSILGCSPTMINIDTGGAIKVTVSAVWTPIIFPDDYIFILRPLNMISSSFRTIIGNVAIADSANPAPNPDPVVQAPVIKKLFLTNPIHVAATTYLYFTILNPNSSTTLTGVAFTDNFPTNMTLATNAVTPQCHGTVTGSAGSGTLSFSGGSIAPGFTCSITVMVTVSMAGVYPNSTTVSATNSGLPGNTASDTLTVGNAVVVLAPVTAKAFQPGSILEGSNSIMTITINNPNQHDALTGVGFVDTFPGGLVLAATPGITSTCGGTLNHTSDSITLVGGTVGKNSSCTIQANVTGSAGTYHNSVIVNTTNGGSGLTASATLAVQPNVSSMTISKSFSPYTIQVGTSSTLTFFITNLSTSIAISGITFEDLLPTGMTVASPPAAAQCHGTVSSTSNSIKLVGGTLAAGMFTTCTVSVQVTVGSITGNSETFTNPSGTASASTINGSISSTWIARDLVVQTAAPPPVCTFSPSSTQPNPVISYQSGPKTVTWTINNTSPGGYAPEIDRLVVFWDGGNMQRTDLDSIILWSGNRTPTTMTVPGVGRTISSGPHSFIFSFPAPDTIFHKNFNATLYFLDGSCPILTTGSWYVH